MSNEMKTAEQCCTFCGEMIVHDGVGWVRYGREKTNPACRGNFGGDHSPAAPSDAEPPEPIPEAAKEERMSWPQLVEVFAHELTSRNQQDASISLGYWTKVSPENLSIYNMPEFIAVLRLDSRDVFDPIFSASPQSAAPQPADGAALIAAERARQMAVEGWTPEHDDEHRLFELSRAAMAYTFDAGRPFGGRIVPSSWPWDTSWWKPSSDPVRNLAKAGALIAAEIDRLQRKNAREEQTNG